MQEMDNYCALCLSVTDEHGVNDQLTLSCEHCFHLNCLQEQIRQKWTGLRITFSFISCALCRAPIDNESLNEEIKPFVELKSRIEGMAIEQLKQEQRLWADLEVENEAQIDERREEILSEIMNILAFYECSKCKEPYCGGMVSCARDIEADEGSLKCQKCVFEESDIDAKSEHETGIKDNRCFEHGYTHAIFKCDSCCSVATYDCIYNHYCDRCHGMAGRLKDFPCLGLGRCPLGVAHPPNLAAQHSSTNPIVPFVFGCMKCAGYDEPNKDFGSNSTASYAFKSQSEMFVGVLQK